MDVSVHREPSPLALYEQSKSRILIIGIVSGVWKDTPLPRRPRWARKVSTYIQTRNNKFAVCALDRRTVLENHPTGCGAGNTLRQILLRTSSPQPCRPSSSTRLSSDLVHSNQDMCCQFYLQLPSLLTSSPQASRNRVEALDRSLIRVTVPPHGTTTSDLPACGVRSQISTHLFNFPFIRSGNFQ